MKISSDENVFLIAHVELDKARFTHGEDMGIDYQNEIDAWTKMEVVFRQQIKLLKECKTLNLKCNQRTKKNKSDLKSLVYSFRVKLD